MGSIPHYQHPHSKSPRLVLLLQSINLRWPIISPYFTLGYNLGVTHSMGLEKHTMICIHHYSTIRNIFTVLKILMFSANLVPLLNPWQLLYCLYSLAFFKTSYSLSFILWKRVIKYCSYLRLKLHLLKRVVSILGYIKYIYKDNCPFSHYLLIH